MTTMKKLIEVKGISEAKAIKIQQSAMKLVPVHISTGCKELDSILGGII